jgi:hypothetical protein
LSSKTEVKFPALLPLPLPLCDADRACLVAVDKIPYIDHPELTISKNESTQMPFRYVKGSDGRPIMPDVSG